MNQLNAVHILKDAWVIVKDRLNTLLSVVGIIVLFNLMSTFLNNSIGESSQIHGLMFSAASRLFLMGLSLGAIRIILDIIHNIETNIKDIFGYFHKLLSYILSSIIFGFCLVLSITPAIIFLLYTFGTNVFETLFASNYLDIIAISQNLDFPIPDLDFGHIEGLVFLFLLIIPLSFVYLRFMFFDYFIIDKDASSLDALRSSFHITRGSVGELLKLILLLAILNFIGALLMFVGLVFTIPLSMVSLGLTYKVLYKQNLLS